MSTMDGNGGDRGERGDRGDRGDRRRDEGGGRAGGPGRRDRRPRRKVCRFCAAKIKSLDVRDVALLRVFLSERGRILSRRTSGNCAKHQRQVRNGIRRARHAALLPYSVL